MNHYSDDFYDIIRSGSTESANAIVPVVLSLLDPVSTLVDIGCGEGVWAKEFEKNGVRVIGIDGQYVANPLVEFIAADLTQPIPLDGKYDLAISLEVAEHLPEESADSFVSELCRLSDNILFSAAVPNQGGMGHVNEKPFSYWEEKFLAHDYYMSGGLRSIFWEDSRIKWWYRQNLMFITRNKNKYSQIFDLPMSKPDYIYHPDRSL